MYLPPRAPNSKEIKFITFPPIFLIYGIFGQHLPKKREFCREEEEGHVPRYLWFFSGTVTPQAAPRNIFLGAANSTSCPWKLDF